jgi:RNA polymerase sigma factor (sigma-70 family)
VTKIARDYRGYGLPISEAISEGNVGLLQAVERFEPEKGFRFATYAIWWIKAAIQEYILRSWSLVKMGTTANQRKVFFNLRKAQSKISILDDGDSLWLQPTSRIASRIRTSRERADSQFGVASCVRKGGRATTERPMPQIKPMSAKRALRRRWPDVLLRLPLENLRMYGERKE